VSEPSIAPITVNIRIDVEDSTGSPLAVTRECTRRWCVETIEDLLAAHTTALQEADRSDIVIVALSFSELVNGRRAVQVKSTKSKPSSLAALERAFAALDPRLWSEKLLHGNVAITVGACPLPDSDYDLLLITEQDPS
jgi:hypothetical protein